MSARHQAAAVLLSLAFLIPGCSDSENPTQLMNGPDGAVHDAALDNTCPIGSATENVTVEEDDDVRISVFTHDRDGDPVQIIITSLHRNAFVRPSGGGISYEPDDDICGTDVVRFKVYDGTCYSMEDTVNVTITCVNDCPEPQGQALEATRNGSVGFDLGPFGDVDEEQLTYAIQTSPAHGTVVINPSGGAGTYTPAPGYCGPDEFKFTASDGICEPVQATVTIDVDCGDSDGDGVSDTEDDCADSIIGATVVIDGCETGVLNSVDANGCTLADIIEQHVDEAAATAANHGKFVSAMTKKLKEMVTGGVITDDQKDAIMSCIGSSGYGKMDPTH